MRTKKKVAGWKLYAIELLICGQVFQKNINSEEYKFQKNINSEVKFEENIKNWKYETWI